MARTRIGIGDLARLLDAAAGPVYVLDDEQRIVFCNQACLEWTGRAADQLQGARCRYHSPEPGSDEAVAAGLCPPPSAWSGRETMGTVGCVSADGRLRRRRARFLPLGNEESPGGVIVVVDLRDLSEAEIEAADRQAPEAMQLHERLRALRHEMAARFRLDRLVGSSTAMRQVRAQVELAAGSCASVLIVGPPGSGRQHLASTIHFGRGPEAAGSLVPLACSVLSADLVRSTLAAMAARGLPPQAVPGTLLLNEADQLPLEAQGDVFQTLASRSFPMRVMSTARQRLADLVRRGEYREDLAGLLSTLVIELPPLCQRRGDLPALAQWFVEQANARGDKQVLGFSSEAMDLLDAYAWPGNLDELIQVVHEAHQRCEGPEIGPADLPARLHLAAGEAAHPRKSEEPIVLDEFLAKVERELLSRALARAKGNKSKAAKLLGMTRPRLYRRLVQAGLVEPGEVKEA
jgi:DNA-binding NtrC family response regulator